MVGWNFLNIYWLRAKEQHYICLLEMSKWKLFSLPLCIFTWIKSLIEHRGICCQVNIHSIGLCMFPSIGIGKEQVEGGQLFLTIFIPCSLLWLFRVCIIWWANQDFLWYVLTSIPEPFCTFCMGCNLLFALFRFTSQSILCKSAVSNVATTWHVLISSFLLPPPKSLWCILTA